MLGFEAICQFFLQLEIINSFDHLNAEVTRTSETMHHLQKDQFRNSREQTFAIHLFQLSNG